MSEQPAKRRRLERMDDLVSLCARRGFIFPSSEIYGGINGFWDYGPLGTELKQNLKALWWQRVVRERPDVEGIDSAIIAHPRTWEASGHVEHFSDPMVDCTTCKKPLPRRPARRRALPVQRPRSARSPQHDLTEPRNFNLMLSDPDRRVGGGRAGRLSARRDLPADLQRLQARARGRRARRSRSGSRRSARRSATRSTRATSRSARASSSRPSSSSSCTRASARSGSSTGRPSALAFHRELGFADERLRTRAHAPDELAHYARAAVDVEYLFPFGWQEIEGIHDRGDWDLSRHSQYSGKDLGITDPDTKEHYMPMVIETSVGIDRTCLALLCDAYAEEELAPGDTRVVMRFPAALAPVSVAVLPLSKKLAEPALALERELRRRFNVFYDDAGNIGRRYRRQDEAGTPYCVTIDFETGGDGKVTVRERDSMDQERIAIAGVGAYVADRLGRPA